MAAKNFKCDFGGDIVQFGSADLDMKKLSSLARLAEAAERYSDMAMFMRVLIENQTSEKKILAVDERNLFSVAYKNVIGAVRASWRTLNSGEFNETPAELIKSYRVAVEAKMQIICREVLTLLGARSEGGDFVVPGDDVKVDSGLLSLYPTNTEQNKMKESGNDDQEKTAKDAARELIEAKIFYMKMCGDYFRYLAEYNSKEGYEQKAKEWYQVAMTCCDQNLKPTHPTRLGLALNFSVCYYEILKQPKEACTLAKKAFDAAIEKLDTLNDASYKDSTLIMQLLRDNLTLWTSEGTNEDDNAGNEDQQ